MGGMQCTLVEYNVATQALPMIYSNPASFPVILYINVTERCHGKIIARNNGAESCHRYLSRMGGMQCGILFALWCG